MQTRVHHNEAAARFELPLGEHLALCSYRRVGDLLVLHHTEVPPALQGQGVAAELVAATLAWAGAQGLQVRPACSYVAAYMRRHPETHGLLERPADRA
jgi:predicted GNAT family acetyltransferase